MAHLTFKIATMFSTVMLALAVLLFLLGYIVNPLKYHLSFREDSHVGVSSDGFDSRLVFFNDAEYGPYRGSIIGLVDADGNAYPPMEREESFGDSWGVYYRHFQWPDSTLWTLMVTLWYPVALFAIMPITNVLYYAIRRRSRTLAEQ